MSEAMRVLVTGTAGFIGMHVAHRLLDAGAAVVASTASIPTTTSRSRRRGRPRSRPSPLRVRASRPRRGGRDGAAVRLRRIQPRRAPRCAAGRALLAGHPGATTATTWWRSGTCWRAAGTRGSRTSSTRRRRRCTAPTTRCLERGPAGRPPGEPVRGDKKANELVAHTTVTVPPADDRAALLHRLRSWGGPTWRRCCSPRDPRGRADQGVQPRQDAPRLHVRRRHRRGVVRVLGARPARVSPPVRRTRLQHRQPRRGPVDRVHRTLERLLGREAQQDLQPMQPGDVEAPTRRSTACRGDGLRAAHAARDGLARFVAWYRGFYGA